MAETRIQWTDYTFNPWWGCERVSPGCAHCYADTLATRFGEGLWGPGHRFRFFGDKHWEEPMRWARTAPARLGRRPRVFTASMADVFEERDELDEARERLFATIALTPTLDWQVLTKRPEFARDWLAERWEVEKMPNFWLGVSIENARFTWRADVLREIPAAVRFISAEPLLGSLFANPSVRYVGETERFAKKPLDLSGIDWVIIGGESGSGARPFRLEWAREIRTACALSEWSTGRRPALFVKQLGAKPVDLFGDAVLMVRDRKGGNPDEWPPDLRIREFPR